MAIKKKLKWAAIQPLIGGMAIGAFQAIGHKPEFIVSQAGVQGNEEHLRQYWPDVPYFIVDSANGYAFVDEADKVLFDKLNRDIDIVIGVPICSGLSQLNVGGGSDPSKKRGSDACQNQNMYDIARFGLERIDAKVLVAENAPGLYTNLGKGVREKLETIAAEHGRSITFYKTNTNLHGIPQNRPRTFFFMWKSDTAPVMDWFNIPVKPLTEFLADVPKDVKHQNYDEAVKFMEKDFSYKFIKHKLGDNYRQLMLEKNQKTGMQYIAETPERLQEAIDWAQEQGEANAERMLIHAQNKFADGKGIWDWTIHIFVDQINAVIGRNMANGVHPTEDRYITIREYMALMGMPHDFNLVADKFKHHVTQNVPVCTAKSMVEQCVKFVDGKLPNSNAFMVMQSNGPNRIENLPKSGGVSLEEFF